MIELMANPALRTFVRTWSIILAGSCGGMVAVVLLVLWVMNGYHGLGIDPVLGTALILGSIVATALCVCLMGLLFYSDSSGKDEAISDEARSHGDSDSVKASPYHVPIGLNPRDPLSLGTILDCRSFAIVTRGTHGPTWAVRRT